MTDVPATLSGAECNGDRPPDNSQQHTYKINEETTDMDGSPPCSRLESSLDLSPKENQEESGKSQGSMLTKWPMGEKIQMESPEENLLVVHKAITDLTLQGTSAEEMAFREGHQWEKIPLSRSNQEVSRPKERITERPVEEREDQKKAFQATEIEWLGFRKPSQVDMLHSEHDEEKDVWNDETNDGDDCDGDEDEVRVIEFKKKYEESSQLREEGSASEDSPLSSPGSQPGTPDEQPMLGKKGDVSRNAYARYNTISYRKIRKGNTKQRIDEFESMMHL
uniref:ermin isoform X1 n=1 Tax=Jaculus jaculus TaxID=51337 RepID=UPI001E1B414C|nr:ermin isoform X1 [Jaculus jaculus]